MGDIPTSAPRYSQLGYHLPPLFEDHDSEAGLQPGCINCCEAPGSSSSNDCDIDRFAQFRYFLITSGKDSSPPEDCQNAHPHSGEGRNGLMLGSPPPPGSKGFKSRQGVLKAGSSPPAIFLNVVIPKLCSPAWDPDRTGRRQSPEWFYTTHCHTCR